MIQQVLSYNPTGKTFLALEHSGQNGSSPIQGILVLLKKGELDIVKSFSAQQVSGIPDLQKSLHKVSLAITDDNVLVKEVNNINSDGEVLSDAFPNLNLEDFYYQVLKTQNKSFVAVCRKQYVDELIDNYQKEGITVTDVSLGNLKAASIVTYIRNDELITNSGVIQLQNGEIVTILPKNDALELLYSIDGLSVNSAHLLSLSLIIDALSPQAVITGNIEEKNAHLQKQYQEVSFFKKALQYGVGFLLITLLINFFVFNSKYKKWQGLQEEIQVYTNQNESIKKQQSVVLTKEAIVNSILTTGFSKSSFYMDQIVQSLPTSVLLKSFTYQPISKTIRADKPISIKEHTVSVTGTSIDKANFTVWLNTIEHLDFVNTVTIINYGTSTNNTSSFEITIDLADDTTK
ncbi:hypothetical protein [Aquimarina spongiae]|uniref:Uncharacterized protein n=1 Tax=Aquimarina spongiae TaxID=570521 RepID=A0A1M6EKL9_9FLAO|nr:hypothetical protein [Aquimarina spongiae]SHI86003.1 hypothetical protein SAMN04488508_103452 [Aquimarina spongiae]